MKKNIILFLIYIQVVGCQNKNIKLTPDKYISEVKVPKELYLNDSIKLVELIKTEIKGHKGAYFSKSYDDSTQIIIDTIMYNKDFNKIIFFIIDKAENFKSVEKRTDLSLDGNYYTGKAYIGIRVNEVLKINNFFRIETANYQKIEEVKKRLREIYFEEYSAVKEDGFEYNLDDIRFWNNPNVWNIIQEDELKWKEFEKEKKKNPKNVYHPKSDSVSD